MRAVMQRPSAVWMSSQRQLKFLTCVQDRLLCCRHCLGTMIPTRDVSCHVFLRIIPWVQHGHLRVFLDANPLRVLLDHIQDHLLHET